MKKRYGQISVEYLMIMGFAMAVIIPTGYVFYHYSQTSNEEAVRTQINKMGNAMLSTAEAVYSAGEGTVNTIELVYPNNVYDVRILNKNELIIMARYKGGDSEEVFFSKILISGNYTFDPDNPDADPRAGCSAPCDNSVFGSTLPSSGTHRLRFESKSDYVFITTLT